MKISLRLVFLFLMTGTSIAQSLCRRLPGYWETTEHHLDSSLLCPGEKIQQQSFYFLSKHKFQRNIIYNLGGPHNDTLIYQSYFRASWNNKRIFVSDRNRILKNTGQLMVIDRFKSDLKFSNDSSFVLMNNLYHRSAKNNIVVLDLPPPRRYFFYIQNLTNEKKRVRVPADRVQMQVDESGLPGEHLSRMNTTECVIDSISGDSLNITLLGEEIEVEHRNKFASMSTNYYAGSFNKVSKKIALKDILYLNMRSPFRQGMYTTGSIIMGLSILTIITSPAFGLNLQGEERANIRNTVFTSGLTGFAIALPVLIIGKNKKYALSPNFKTSARNYWVLKQTETRH